ncbi:MAG: type I-U CRISPR-associated helicase/endonuclease Cas3 [Planctomycetota bacterium]
MLTGTIRGLERDKLVEDPAFQRFLPNSESAFDDTVFLIATSAGEVGVNLSAAHLICDLVPFERMAQRFGRLNRFGEYPNASAEVCHLSAKDDCLIETLALLNSLDGDASPSNLATLDAGQRDSASTAVPEIVPATDVLFDALSLTTIRDLPTCPDSLDSLLHGVVDKEIPRTTVAWRQEVEELDDIEFSNIEPEELLQSFRLKPHETLSDTSKRVLDQLKKLAKEHSNHPLWLIDLGGKIERKRLGQILDKDLLAHRTVLLPPSVGGLSKSGTLDGKAAPTEASLDVSCHYKDRLRTWETEWPGEEWTLIRRLDLTLEGEEEARIWSWYERAWGGDGIGQQTSKVVFLEDHAKTVAKLARSMAESLGFDSEICSAIEFAGVKHDQGKSRRTWQAAAGKECDSPDVAKPLERSFSNAGFRHELASLVDLQADPEFAKFSVTQQNLIQHLIAAHHGRARPMFPENEIHDPETPRRLVHEIASQVPARFASLQEKFGHWGLAYIESILRAADYAASAGRRHKEESE